MNEHVNRLALAVTAASVGMWLTGCACHQKAKPVAAAAALAAAPSAQAYAEAKPAPRVMTSGNCATVRVDGAKTTAAMAFPTGNADTSVILLENSAPTEVQVGEAYDSTMKVTNLTDCPLGAVVVTDQLPANFDLVASNPQAKVTGDGVATWDIGSLAPRESKLITVRGTSKAAGDIVSCARVDYRTQLCLPVSVIAPKLQLTKALPAEALMCDTIPVRLTVTNSGSGSARNVKVSDPLPAGLTTLDGKNVVEFEVPVLPAGQSKEATFQVKAAKTGTYANRATAVASGGLSSEASASVIVRQPVLTISKRATDKQYAGRNIAYELVVANKGDVTAQNVLVADRIPAGTALISTSDGGVANSNGVIEWRVGSLAPDAAKKVSFVVRAVQKGTITNTAEAVATCAAPVRDQTVSEVVGIPAILLEVVDIDDPIEVGKTETYVITVTNQGSETDTNIAIACTLEDSQSYVSSDGPTAATATGQVIRFAPLPALAAKAKATWKVVIRAEKAGDVRFTTVMSSAQLQRPVQETESTNQY